MENELNRADSTNDVNLKLKNFVDNIESLEAQKKEISSEISYVYKVVKASGFSVKALKRVIALRKLTPRSVGNWITLLQHTARRWGWIRGC